MTNHIFRGLYLCFFLLISNNLIYSGECLTIQDTLINESFKDSTLLVYMDSEWVDSVYKSLSADERIAQLLMIAAYSNRDQQHMDYISRLIKKYNIGGLIFFQGGPYRQAEQTNYYQSVSQTPLLIAMDAEWGLGMRLDSAISYPRQMILGAVQDNDLIYEMGEDIALQLRRLGVHINLAPVVDVNNNPENPVINTRSFGEDRINVANKGLAYMKAMQDNRILATAKHFPGHGDTKEDSHNTLPVIPHSTERLDSIELYPFRYLINNGLEGIMTAHLNIPALDPESGIASSLSKKIIDELLKEQMGYKGLVMTDALNMKGVSDYFESGALEAKAILAGNDLLLMPQDISKAISRIKREVRQGNISWNEIEQRCKKVLALKQWVGLDNFQAIELDSLYEDINTSHSEYLERRLIESAITLVNNNNDLLPLKRLDTLKIASVGIGISEINTFQETLGLYTDVDHFFINKEAVWAEFDTLINKLSDYNLVIVGNFDADSRSSYNYGISRQAVGFIHRLTEKSRVVLDIFANPYSLSKFNGLNLVDVVIMSYTDNKLSQSSSAQLIFGGIPAKGKLPVTATEIYHAGAGIDTNEKIRLKYSVPEEVGIDPKKLYKVDSIIFNAIDQRAIPGCQVLVARNGTVFYYKTYGYHTYLKERPVRKSDIYDLASVTKISATLPSLMKLYDQGDLIVDTTLSTYLPELDTTNKKDIRIKDILAHRSRLIAWIPFYISTLESFYPDSNMYNNHITPAYPYRFSDNSYFIKDFKFKDNIFKSFYSEKFPIKVADNFYIEKSWPDTIYNRIFSSGLRDKNDYKYSDLGFMLFSRLIEKNTGSSLYHYVFDNFYKPLGASTLGFLPLNRFDKSRIVPTENDIIFRKQLVHGYVHDPGAAMLGGICGHAGLFSNANDLAKLMQMYLQKGLYGGVRYFKEGTIDYFSSSQFKESGNRRGLGFDKPEMDYTKTGPTCQCISGDSFGHTGFTGTIAWVDPDKQIVYIFLSNRVHPDQTNTKLIDNDVRTKIQKAIYNAIIEQE